MLRDHRRKGMLPQVPLMPESLPIGSAMEFGQSFAGLRLWIGFRSVIDLSKYGK